MGTRKAVVVGVEYYSIIDKLRGCANDAKRIKDSLIAYKDFKSEDVVLLNDKFGKHYRREKVTSAYICDEINRMLHGAVSGDTLVLFLSGHGGREDPFKAEDYTNGYFLANNYRGITDKFIRDALEDHLPPNCEFTLLLDSCKAGSFKIGPKGILIAACRADQNSKIGYNRKTKKRGSIFTDALVKVMKDNRGKNLTNGKVVGKIEKIMRAAGQRQRPLLRCTHAQTNQVFVCRT